MQPEARARQKIDELLTAAGWIVQNRADFDRTAALGVAVREFGLPSGEADYLLFAAASPLGGLRGAGGSASVVGDGQRVAIPSIAEPEAGYSSVEARPGYRGIKCATSSNLN